MWNDTDIPLAYLISFRCYGTWLHGDIRGSMDRKNNVYGSPKLSHEPARKDYIRSQMKRESVSLNARRRSSVEFAIRDTCSHRNWTLLAFNIRTNHVHTVVSIGSKKPELALGAFKANATRQMRDDRSWMGESTPWAEKGSRRYLCNEMSVERAIDYVLNGQGGDLPDFD